MRALVIAILVLLPMAPFAAAQSAEGVLRGVVTDPEGAPVADAAVLAAGETGGFVEARADALGHYELRVPAGVAFVMVRTDPSDPDRRVASRMLDCEAGECPVVPPGGETWANVTLPWAARVHGVVRFPDGAPAPNATVTLQAQGPVLVEGAQTVSADAQGRFRFSAPAGPLLLYALPPQDAPPGLLGGGYACPDATGEDCLVVGANESREADLLLRQGALLRGVVQDTAGAPVAGAYVTAQGPEGSPTARADTQGAYLLTLAPGEHRLLVQSTAENLLRRIEPACPEGCVRVEAGAVAWRNHTLPGLVALRVRLLPPEAAAEGARVDLLGPQGVVASAYVEDGHEARLLAVEGAYGLAVEPLSPRVVVASGTCAAAGACVRLGPEPEAGVDVTLALAEWSAPTPEPPRETPLPPLLALLGLAIAARRRA